MSASSLPSDEGAGYPASMSLPSWAADAVAKLSDHDHLVLMEGSLYSDDTENPVLAVAHITKHTSGRSEMQVLAVITDTNLQERIHFDNEEMRVYPFVR